MDTVLKKADLYCQENGSDKFYDVSLIDKGNGSYRIFVERGRRNSSYITDNKEDSITTLEKAQKSYLSLVRSKLNKGYKCNSGNPCDFTGIAIPISSLTAKAPKVIAEKVATGTALQLLNDVEDGDVEKYLQSDAWGMQEKYDGCRLSVKHITEIVASNKKNIVIGTSKEIEDLLKSVSKTVEVDGENVGGKYYIFDLMHYDGDLRNESVLSRYNKLKLKAHVVDMYLGYEAKKAKFEEIRARGGEGVVFKQLSSKYVGGRPSKGGMQLKYKFWKSDTFIVSSIHATKSSVGISTIKDGKREVIGNATIPPNYPFPKLGDFVEIIYLYCYPNGGAVYQPKYKGIRNDQDESDCRYEKLKFKVTDSDDD
jgi:bifunctional non-homologous end joining protein LigD